MGISNKRAVSLIAGLTWALVSGSAAFADDTELFFVDPSNITAQPNILFIIDNSGSMDDRVDSQTPYNAATPYAPAGGCASDRIYWTTSGGTTPPLPDCTTSNNWFNKSALVCKAALDLFAANAERFRGRLQQYNSNTSGSSPRTWLGLAAAQKTRVVECRDDRGVHSDGVAAGKYARNGNSLSAWGNSSSEIGWTTTQTTLFDGNYLNWYYGPTGPQRKIDVVKAVATNMLNTIQGVNVGLAIYNVDEGGNVHYAMEDITTARTSIVSTVNNIALQTFTPLSETLYESYLYLNGGAVRYGNIGPLPSVNASRTAPGGATYKTPLEEGCQKNFIVYLSDGLPTQDKSANSDIEGLIGGTCDGTVDDGYCLDDLAQYMHNKDVNDDVDGDQTVTTYTIGFDLNIPILQETAADGGGAYFTANNSASLTTALTSILFDILKTSSTFTAPAVSVNSFNRTRNLNDLYVSVFTATGDTHWPGNLKKYQLRPSDGAILDNSSPKVVAVDADGFFAEGTQSFWSATPDGASVTSGGAASNLPLPAAREVYTYLNGGNLKDAGNQVVVGNGAIDDTVLNTGGTGRPTRTQIIDFIRGAHPVTGVPLKQMGDPLHSQPASVTYDADETIVYFVTNDGYLHAVNSEDGKEVWAFVPPEFLDDQVDLFLNQPTDTRHYGIDGSPRLQLVANNDGVISGSEKVYLFFGMRRGGDFYYGLDVTDPDNPQVMWRLPGAGAQALPGIGQTWSNPMPARIKIGTTSYLALVFGAGYDTKHDEYNMSGTDASGKGIFIVDSVTGNVLWSGAATGASRNFAKMNYSIPGDVRVVDLNTDGYSDRMYAADMGGQVWKFDIYNGQDVANLVTGGVIAQLGGAPAANPPIASTRRFYYAPDVALVSADVPFIHVGIGSGHRERPNSTFNTDRFYALRDYTTFQQTSQAIYDGLVPITDAALADVTSDPAALIPANGPGWKMRLTDTGEKVLAEGRTFNNAVFFTSFTPGAGAGGNTTNCRPALGTNRLYMVSVFNGAPVNNLDGSLPTDPLSLTDRSLEFKGSLPSEVVFIFPSPEEEGPCVGDQCTPPPIACVDLFCFPPGFANNPIRTFWSQESLD